MVQFTDRLRSAALAAVAAGALALGGCGGGDDGTSVLDLNSSEVESLYYMREEEKLAHDTYVALYEVWKDQVFSNVAASEQQHTEAVRALIDKYGLIDPAAGKAAGEFANPLFKQIYDQYVALGTQSRVAAFAVGVTIEELDMKDIAHWMSLVDNPDIVNVYESLMCGSRNHLRSYYGTLVQLGGTYVAQFISQAEFDAIVGSPMETCG